MSKKSSRTLQEIVNFIHLNLDFVDSKFIEDATKMFSNIFKINFEKKDILYLERRILDAKIDNYISYNKTLNTDIEDIILDKYKIFGYDNRWHEFWVNMSLYSLSKNIDRISRMKELYIYDDVKFQSQEYREALDIIGFFDS